MRNLRIVPVILLLVFSSCSQFNKSDEIKELSLKVDSLSSKVDELSEQNRSLEEEFSWIESEMVELSKLKQEKMATPLASPSAKATGNAKTTQKAKASENTIQDGQCQAITNSGKRCSRVALKGSKYCWQHKETYEPEIPKK